MTLRVVQPSGIEREDLDFRHLRPDQVGEHHRLSAQAAGVHHPAVIAHRGAQDFQVRATFSGVWFDMKRILASCLITLEHQGSDQRISCVIYGRMRADIDFCCIAASYRPTGTAMSRISLRRLRQDPHIRARPADPPPPRAVHPAPVRRGGPKQRETIPGLTGVYRDTPETLLAQIESDLAAGVSKFLLFGVPTAHATHAISWAFTSGQVAAIKRFGKNVWLAVDACLVLLHPPWPLRRAEPGRRSPGQRAQRRGTGGRGRGLRARRRRLRRAQRHDGRPNRRHPARAR